MPCENHPEIEEGLDACYGCGLPFCPNCLVTLFELKYCAACKGEAVKDMHSGVERSGTLPLASLWARFAALFLDGLIYAVLMLPILFGVGFSTGIFDPEAGPTENMEGQLLFQGLAMMLSFIPFIYEGLMTQWRGQTLGKMALGIKIVTESGADIRPGQAWIRALIRLLLGWCCNGIPDYIAAFFTDGKACIHDMAAKTRVVKL